MGLSENVGYIPNEIAIFHRDNDQQNHWVQWGTLFSDTPIFWGYIGIVTTIYPHNDGQYIGIHRDTLVLFMLRYK